MKNTIEKQVKSLNKNIAPDDLVYSKLLESINFKIDIDFLEFIKKYNGAEGILGENNFILFWKIEQLIALNPYYKGVKECDGLLFFASNGSNLGYAFEKKSGWIVGIDFLDISFTQPEIMAQSFDLFLNKLVNDEM